MQDSGKPEDAGTASRKVREPRQLGEPSAGAEGGRLRGDPKKKPKAKPEGAGAGKLATTPEGAFGSAKPKGNPKHQRQKRRRTQAARKLTDPSPAQPEDAGCRETCSLIGRYNWKSVAAGKPKATAPEVLKDGTFEATRRAIAGKAGRCKSRGDPGNASVGANERVKSGAT
jgi:hypothetical protein